MDHTKYRMLEKKIRQADPAWDWLENLLGNTSVPIRIILEELYKKDSHALLGEKELRNWRAQLFQKRLDNYSDIQSFVKSVEEGAHIHRIEWENEPVQRPRHICWSLQEQVTQWSTRPEVISVDATYKTNRTEMPLLFATIAHPEGLTIPVAQAVLADESVESYRHFLQTLREFMEEEGIRRPEVILSDGDPQFITALSFEFPKVQHQRCIWHLSCNVVTYLKTRFRKSVECTQGSDGAHEEEEDQEEEDDEEEDEEERDMDEKEMRKLHQNVSDWRAKSASLGDVRRPIVKSRAGAYFLWQHMVFSTSADQYTTAWSRLQKIFAGFEFLEDIRRFNEFKKLWAGYIIMFYPNQGRRTTSPNESLHSAVKAYHISIKTGFTVLYDCVERWVKNRLIHDRNFQSDARRRLPRDCIKAAWCGDVAGKIAKRTLKALCEQRLRYLASRPCALHPAGIPLPPCTGSFRQQKGLPCAHSMERKAEEGISAWITMADVHPFHHLKISRVQDFLNSIRMNLG